MTDELIVKYNRSLWALIFYYPALVVLVGLTYKQDVVGSMVIIVELYGLPLFAFLFIYTVIMANAVYKRFRHKREFQKILIPVTIKTTLATLPMFFFDNRLSVVLNYLNHL